MIAAIILAAGKSTRMGRPKALVEYDGKPFLRSVMDNLKQAGVENTVVVLGHQSEQIADALDLSEDHLVINENYEMGQFSSFQRGIRALSRDTDGAFLALVDQPQIGPYVIRMILTTFLANSDRIVLPAYRGKRGHPPVFPRQVFEAIRSAPPAMSARDILTEHESELLEIEVEDESILWNINTEQDLQQVRHRMKTVGHRTNFEEN